MLIAFFILLSTQIHLEIQLRVRFLLSSLDYMVNQAPEKYTHVLEPLTTSLYACKRTHVAVILQGQAGVIYT